MLPSFIVYSEKLAEDLWVAADVGNVNRVKTLLQQGANPSHPMYWRKHWWNQQKRGWPGRYSPLHTACQRGHLEIVKLLIQAGANVDEGDDNFKSTPLHTACGRGQKEVAVDLIREAGCKVGEFLL